MSDPEPGYHLFLDTTEVPVAAAALGLLILAFSKAMNTDWY